MEGHGSLQGWNADGRFVELQSTPVVDQRTLMETSPLDDERQDPWWQVAVEDTDRAEPQATFTITIRGMAMRWAMILEVHPNHDTQEA
jgi:hypothetical protein